jgi:hypothetical protein
MKDKCTTFTHTWTTMKFWDLSKLPCTHPPWFYPCSYHSYLYHLTCCSSLVTPLLHTWMVENSKNWHVYIHYCSWLEITDCILMILNHYSRLEMIDCTRVVQKICALQLLSWELLIEKHQCSAQTFWTTLVFWWY